MTEMNAFEQRLRALEARYNELGALLSAPDAYQDLDRVQQLSREQAKLREVVEAARRWRDAQDAAREAEEMAHAESDPQMVAMAEEEQHAQIAAAEAEYEQAARAAAAPPIPTTSATSSSRFAPAPAVTRRRSSPPTSSACTSRYAERQRWRIEVLDQNETAGHGFKEIVFEVHGQRRVLAAQVRVRRAPRAARARRPRRRDASTRPPRRWSCCPRRTTSRSRSTRTT